MRRKRTAAVCLGLAIAVSAFKAWPQQVPNFRRKVVAPSAPIVFHLEPYLGNSLALRATVDGHSGLFLFDTGGGVSVLDTELATSIHCERWGRITGFRMTGERLDMPRCDHVLFVTGGVDLHQTTVGVLDFTKLLPPDAPHLNGSIGLDVFAGSKITFNSAEHVVILESQRSFLERRRKAHEVPLLLVRDAGGFALTVKVGVPTAKGLAWMELDSGNGGPVAIANDIAPLLGLHSGSTATLISRFDLAPGITVNEPIRTEDMIMDGNLGASFLQKWIVSIDLSEGRAWLSPSSESASRR